MTDSGFYRIDALEITPEFIEKWRRRGLLKREVEESWDKLPDRWIMLRKVYKEHEAEMMAAAMANPPRGGIDPYYVDWMPLMTPIEYDAWCCIRPKGLTFYPQVPVLNYFLDFANPYLKIAVEMDGKQHDIQKDGIRDGRLVEAGWKVFRIPGRECYREYRQDYEIYEDSSLSAEQRNIEIRERMVETSEGVFDAIRLFYFGGRDRHYLDWAYESLDKHRIVDFHLGGPFKQY